MRYLRRFLTKCIGFVRNRHADAELDREIHAHLALLEDDYRQMGAPGSSARPVQLRGLLRVRMRDPLFSHLLNSAAARGGRFKGWLRRTRQSDSPCFKDRYAKTSSFDEKWRKNVRLEMPPPVAI